MNRNKKSGSVYKTHIPLDAPLIIRLSPRMIVLCVLFSLIASIIGYGMIFMLVNPIYIEEDTLMPVFFKVVIAAVASVVETGILFMVIPLWKRIFRDGAMTLTQAGIENTFVLFSVFAFWTILPIRFIPWNALQLDESDDACCCVDVRQLPPGSIGIIAKLMIRFTGFHFRVGQISKEDLEYYRKTVLDQFGRG